MCRLTAVALFLISDRMIEFKQSSYHIYTNTKKQAFDTTPPAARLILYITAARACEWESRRVANATRNILAVTANATYNICTIIAHCVCKSCQKIKIPVVTSTLNSMFKIVLNRKYRMNIIQKHARG